MSTLPPFKDRVISLCFLGQPQSHAILLSQPAEWPNVRVTGKSLHLHSLFCHSNTQLTNIHKLFSTFPQVSNLLTLQHFQLQTCWAIFTTIPTHTGCRLGRDLLTVCHSKSKCLLLITCQVRSQTRKKSNTGCSHCHAFWVLIGDKQFRIQQASWSLYRMNLSPLITKQNRGKNILLRPLDELKQRQSNSREQRTGETADYYLT